MMRTTFVGMTALALLATATMATAQLEVGEGARDKADLIREVEPQPPTFPVNSAIVLTNPYGRPGEFKIELYDHDGNVAGGGSVVVAPRALEVVWVSTLLNDGIENFVGWGLAKSTHALECNAYLAGIGVTELPVKEQRLRNTDTRSRRKLFSILAAY